MRHGRVRTGTSGWTYPHWRGRFYPRDVPVRSWLAYLATRLPAVEINGTFYSMGRPGTFERWRSEVPRDFLFALKGSRYLTHMLKLRRPEAPLANFFAQGILLLGEQLGPILWQLPGHFGFDAERARAFFAALPRDVRAAEKLARKHDRRLSGRAATRAPDGRERAIRHALEVRHESWLSPEARALAAKHGVALVAAETAGKHPFCDAVPGSGLVYVRLHGSRELYRSRYTDHELAAWARICAGHARAGRDVFVFFDNTDAPAGHAPFDAERLGRAVERAMRRLAA